MQGAVLRNASAEQKMSRKELYKAGFFTLFFFRKNRIAVSLTSTDGPHANPAFPFYSPQPCGCCNGTDNLNISHFRQVSDGKKKKILIEVVQTESPSLAP